MTTANITHRKPFKFFNFMTSHSEFLPRIAQVWLTSPPLFHSRAALILLHRKLNSLKYTLRELNWSKFGNLPQQTFYAYSLLFSAQQRAFTGPSQTNVKAVLEASDKWHKIMTIEEQFFKQKSRIQWLQCGDQNTAFFHHVAQSNVSRNAIRRLTTETGVVLTQPDDIRAEAAMHFREFLQQEATNFHEIPPAYLLIC